MLHSTYYWPEGMSLNDNDLRRHDIKYIRYYPYIYMLFLISSIFLIIPNVIWRVMSNSSGYGITKIISTLRVYQQSLIANQNSSLFMTISYNFSNLSSLRHKRKIYNPTPWYLEPLNSLYPKYLVTNFLIQKALYTVSLVIIFLIWNFTLRNEFYDLGIDFLKRISSGNKYVPSKLFPHYSLCDATLHGLKMTKYTFECYMTRNVFLDIILTGIWFILVLSFLFSLYNLIKTSLLFLSADRRNAMLASWMNVTLIPTDGSSDRRLNCPGCSNLREDPCQECKIYMYNSTFCKSSLEKFARERLSIDLIFCLWLVSIKTVFGEYNASTILSQLWKRRDIPFNYYRPAKITNKQFVYGSESSGQSTEVDYESIDKVV
ncbi:MAG: hypothetical protein MHMPM18_002967 [Marteilia pararefringens]